MPVCEISYKNKMYKLPSMIWFYELCGIACLVIVNEPNLKVLKFMNVELWGEKKKKKMFPYLKRKWLFVCLFAIHLIQFHTRRGLAFSFGF